MAMMASASKTAARRSSSSRSTSASSALRPSRLPQPLLRPRALSTEASSSEPRKKKEQKLTSSIFGQGRPLALLERHVAPPSPPSSPPPASDLSLWRTGAFACEVYPDLPVAASWRGLLRAASGGLLDSEVDATTGDAPGVGRRRRRRRKEEGEEGEEGGGGGESSPPLLLPSPPPASFVVRTVAAQVRGLGSVRARIQRAAGVGPEGRALSLQPLVVMLPEKRPVVDEYLSRDTSL